MTTNSSVSRVVYARQLGTTEPLRVTLGYRSDDPYAMTLVFPVHHGTVEWVIARDLLNDGVKEPSGEGDVRIRPHGANAHITVVSVSSPSGEATFHFDTNDLAEFVFDTYEVVPPDTEWSAIDWDAEFGRLAT